MKLWFLILYLLAGQALQRVLLTACRHGLQAGYLNQPLQVASLRPQLATLTGGGFPQIVLGWDSRPARSPPARAGRSRP